MSQKTHKELNVLFTITIAILRTYTPTTHYRTQVVQVHNFLDDIHIYFIFCVVQFNAN